MHAMTDDDDYNNNDDNDEGDYDDDVVLIAHEGSLSVTPSITIIYLLIYHPP